jgi:hypothetical protein
MAGTDLDFSPEQVTRALRELVAHAGDPTAAAEALVDDEFQVPVATLRRWKRDTHAEQYRRLEEEYGRELERIAAEQARATIVRAGQIERDLLERVKDAPPDVAPQALRAAADVKSKNVDKLLALTGRAGMAPAPSDFGSLLRHMQARGYVKLNVTLEGGDQPPGPEQPAIDGTAEEAPPA